MYKLQQCYVGGGKEFYLQKGGVSKVRVCYRLVQLSFGHVRVKGS